MRHYGALMLGALSIAQLCAAPANAQEPTLSELRRQVEELEERVALLKRGETAQQQLAVLKGNALPPAPTPPPAATPPPNNPSAAGPAATANAPPPPPKDTQAKLAADDDGKQKFGGIEFGVGIAFTYDLGNNRRIKEAELVNGLVRITDEENLRARIVLESHYFFTPRRLELFGLKNKGNYQTRVNENGTLVLDSAKRPILDYVPDNNVGIGPFIAFQPGTDNVIEGIGAGLMIGMRRPAKDSTESFNIGIGVLYDLNTKLLGEGLTRNQPLPPGETMIRYRETSQSGLLIMSSYSF